MMVGFGTYAKKNRYPLYLEKTLFPDWAKASVHLKNIFT
jgi:hypothetical protein